MVRIDIVMDFIKYITYNNLVSYHKGTRLGDPEYYTGTPFHLLPKRKQMKIAERLLREYDSMRYWDDLSDWEYADQCWGSPYWVLAYLYGEKYARMIITGEEPVDDEDEEEKDYYDEEEDCLLGVRTRQKSA